MSGLLDQMKKGADGIYGSVAAGGSQQVEIDMRRDGPRGQEVPRRHS